jgi:hypothetical protein
MFRVVLVFSFLLGFISIIRQYIQDKGDTYLAIRSTFGDLIGLLLFVSIIFLGLFFLERVRDLMSRSSGAA